MPRKTTHDAFLAFNFGLLLFVFVRGLLCSISWSKDRESPHSRKNILKIYQPNFGRIIPGMIVLHVSSRDCDVYTTANAERRLRSFDRLGFEILRFFAGFLPTEGEIE